MLCYTAFSSCSNPNKQVNAQDLPVPCSRHTAYVYDYTYKTHHLWIILHSEKNKHTILKPKYLIIIICLLLVSAVAQRSLWYWHNMTAKDVPHEQGPRCLGCLETVGPGWYALAGPHIHDPQMNFRSLDTRGTPPPHLLHGRTGHNCQRQLADRHDAHYEECRDLFSGSQVQH